MSEQSKAPDVIWRVRPYIPIHSTRGLASWPRKEQAGEGATEYVSRDHCNALIQAFAKDASAHLQNTQIAFESDSAEEWVKGNNSAVKACAAVVRHFSPDETQAAYDAALSAARAEALTEAAALFDKDEKLPGCVVLHRLEKLRGKSDG